MKKKLVTHDGNFHADDVFATAVLSMVFDGKIEVVRSRQERDIAKADIVYDVGSVYDPKQQKYDHHQTEGAGVRENGVPYAAFGLMWKHFGRDLVSSDEVWNEVDTSFVQSIDANDTGYFSPASTVDGFDNMVVDTVIKFFNPTWSETYDESHKRFMELVGVAIVILKRVMFRCEDKVKGWEAVEESYQQADDKRIIILKQGYSWRGVLLQHPEPLFVIFPNKHNSTYMIQAVLSESAGYDTRISFPDAWGGLYDAELVAASGVEGAIFCHRAGFLAGNKTLDGAITMAQKAIDATRK